MTDKITIGSFIKVGESWKRHLVNVYSYDLLQTKSDRFSLSYSLLQLPEVSAMCCSGDAMMDEGYIHIYDNCSSCCQYQSAQKVNLHINLTHI